MTAPAGELIIKVKADASEVPAQFRKTIEEMGLVAGNKGVVNKFSKDLGDNISREIRKHDPLRNAVKDAILDGERLGRGPLRLFARRFGQIITGGILNNTSPLRLIFKQFANTFGSTLGSIFNIAGRSPAAFAPLLLILGAVGGLIAALIHGLHALIALLYLIPNLLFAIGLQASALFLIFHGFFDAFGALTAAKNLGELNKALKGVNPAMAQFIRTLFPIKELLTRLSDAAKTKFFTALGDVFTRINKAIGPTFVASILTISQALGNMLNSILSFFTEPLFKNFMAAITPSIAKWLTDFGPAVRTFLEGLTRFGIATLPFLDKFGEKFNNIIEKIGAWFDKLSQDPQFLQWLNEAYFTLQLFFALLGQIIDLFQILADNIKKGGGDLFLFALSALLKALGDVFKKIGPDAMRGFLFVFFIALFIIGALLVALGEIFWIIGKIMKFVQDLVLAFLRWKDHVKDTTHEVVAFIQDKINTALSFLKGIGTNISNFFHDRKQDIIDTFQNLVEKIQNFFTGTIPDTIRNAVTDFKNLLVQAGKDLINGLIDGLESAIPGLRFLINGIKALFPGSFSASVDVTGAGGGGKGSLFPGKVPPGVDPAILGGLGGGAVTLGPTNSNYNSSSAPVNVHPGAVQVNLNSTYPPTAQQSQTIGQNVAIGMQQQMVAQSIRGL